MEWHKNFYAKNKIRKTGESNSFLNRKFQVDRGGAVCYTKKVNERLLCAKQMKNFLKGVLFERPKNIVAFLEDISNR